MIRQKPVGLGSYRLFVFCFSLLQALERMQGNYLSPDIRNKIAITLSGDSEYIEKRDKIIFLYKNGMTKKEISLKLEFDLSICKAAVNWYKRQK